MNNNSSPNVSYYQNQPVSLQTNQMQQSSPSNYIMATNQQPQQQQYYQQPNNTFIQQQNGINVQKQSVNLQNGQMMPNNYQPQMSQQLNGTKPQQVPMQQANPSFVINSNNNQQTNVNNQSAQYYTQQQQPGVVIAQIQQQQPQQVYSTFINQPNVVQTNGISYSTPLQSNRIVYINNSNNIITSNSTVPMNTYQTNGNNICIVQKPLNQQMPNQQIIFAQTPIQPANNQTPNKIQLNQSNGVVNQVSFLFNFK